MNYRKTFPCIVVLLLAGARLPASPLSAQSAMMPLLDSFQTEERYLRGVHDILYSVDAIERMESFYATYTQILAQVTFDELERQDRIDYLLLKNDIQESFRYIGEQRDEIERQKAYVPFAAASLALHAERSMGLYTDPETAARRIADIRKALGDGRKAFDSFFNDVSSSADQKAESNLVVELAQNDATHKLPVAASADAEEKGDAQSDESAKKKQKMAVRFLALQVSRQVAHHRHRLGEWFNHYERFQPGFAWWVKTEWDKTREELEQYEKHLREERAGVKDDNEGPLLGEVIGEAGLNARIREEFIAYSARELLAIGERELAWCEREMEKVARELGVSGWTNVMAVIKEAVVPPGKQADLVAQYVREAADFVKDNALLRVPSICEESWRINMVDKNRQRTLPYALYGGQAVHVAYATRDMEWADMWMSMRGNNLHATRIVVAHEVIPGHHYQIYMSKHHRAYRESYHSHFFVEGWALYWEMRLWNEGFARAAKDRAGMLFWRSHRCARIVLTLKYHLGEMEPEEMIRFLESRIGHEKAQATAEVRRYIGRHTPALYQISYMIGGLQFMALWEEFVKSGQMTEVEFHDALLSHGTIPIDMIRNALKNADLAEDYVPQWRF